MATLARCSFRVTAALWAGPRSLSADERRLGGGRGQRPLPPHAKRKSVARSPHRRWRTGPALELGKVALYLLNYRRMPIWLARPLTRREAALPREPSSAPEPAPERQ